MLDELEKFEKGKTMITSRKLANLLVYLSFCISDEHNGYLSELPSLPLGESVAYYKRPDAAGKEWVGARGNVDGCEFDLTPDGQWLVDGENVRTGEVAVVLG